MRTAPTIPGRWQLRRCPWRDRLRRQHRQVAVNVGASVAISPAGLSGERTRIVPRDSLQLSASGGSGAIPGSC